jgi:hypothetical protein
MATRKEMKQLVAAIERGEGDQKRTWWTKIGVGFVNRDGKSINLRFDYIPADLRNTTIQLRDFNEKEEAESA